MKVLFDIGHPAHVHLFKNFIFYLKQEGIEFIVVTRDKDITHALLDHYDIPFQVLSKPGRSLVQMLHEAFSRTWKIVRLNKKEKFTLSFGTSVSIGFLSRFSFGKVRSFNFNEDDDKTVRLYTFLAYPFSTKIINPDCLEFKLWKKKRILLPSYHELAYLHPANFKPDEKILEKYGLEKRKYVIFRLSALQAHHDIGAKGISQELKKKILGLLDGYEVIESLEGKAGGKIAPWDMHHILAFGKMIICDSQTMAMEAMVLGTPSLRINTFIGKSTCLNELENKYELGFGFFPDQEVEILQTIKSLIDQAFIEEIWQKKKEKMLSEKIDLNEWMMDFFKRQKWFKEILP